MRLPRALITVFPLVTMLSLWPAALATAQGEPPAPGFTVGSQTVDSSFWNFDGDLAIDAGPWGQVTVTNTNCAVPYRPGTAQAGAIIFTATLQTEPTPGGLQLAQGDLLPFTGSVATGHVSVLTPPGTAPTSHVDATLVGLDEFALNNTFSVCVSPADMTGITADVVIDAN